jgi:hypothetical protein
MRRQNEPSAWQFSLALFFCLLLVIISSQKVLAFEPYTRAKFLFPEAMPILF